MVEEVQMYRPGSLDESTIQTQETRLGAFVGNVGHKLSQTDKFIHNHRARIRATGTIAANTIVSSIIAIQSHRAGDSYRTTQMRNTQSAVSNLSSIGIAGAIWGSTAAIAFGVNFAITTGARLFVENANYQFDRKMDTNYIHNMSQVAGDVSYGRVFG